jgi:GNAT superfamily N-acetyltransferase
MIPSTKPEVAIRPALPADAHQAGEICYAAFAAINAAHGYPCDFPSAEATIGIMGSLFADPNFYSVVAEVDGRLVGSNVIDERAIIHGVGPISIDPAAQNLGIGRRLMAAVMERAHERNAAGIRLVQAAFHNRSFSLYASLGFDVREPLACMQGPAMHRSIPGCLVRPATDSDLEPCNRLSYRVHGFDRTVELAKAIADGTARVVEREGRITGYTSHLAYFGHSTCEANLDMQALIADADAFPGPGILVPSRNHALLRWCLQNGLRVIQPMTLMTTGLYNEPAGAWLPSVLF